MIVNKKPHEHLGVMIVESGWGSMIPCAIIAHLAKDGPAAKSGRLNVGDQILSVNGTSLVGLPLLECQNVIKVGMDVIVRGMESLKVVFFLFENISKEDYEYLMHDVLNFQSIRPTTKVTMKIVSCPPTVQVVVNRPDTKYQLGFSVQNGMVIPVLV